MGRTYSTHGENGSVYRILVGKPEGKRELRTPRRRRMDNIKSGFRKIRGGDMD
jgi:hypothetical protein